jgi:hypothetical protein
MSDLTNKVALETGASRGIGAAIAIQPMTNGPNLSWQPQRSSVTATSMTSLLWSPS